MVGYSSIHGVTYWLMTSYNWYFGPFHRNVRIQSLIHRSLICYTPLIPWTHEFDIHANGYDITNILGKQSNIIQQTHNWYTQPGWWFHPLWTNMSQLRSFSIKHVPNHQPEFPTFIFLNIIDIPNQTLTPTKYPLVNVYITNWKDPPCYSWEHPLFRLGHGFNS